MLDVLQVNTFHRVVFLEGLSLQVWEFTLQSDNFLIWILFIIKLGLLKGLKERVLQYKDLVMLGIGLLNILKRMEVKLLQLLNIILQFIIQMDLKLMM